MTGQDLFDLALTDTKKLFELTKASFVLGVAKPAVGHNVLAEFEFHTHAAKDTKVILAVGSGVALEIETGIVYVRTVPCSSFQEGKVLFSKMVGVQMPESPESARIVRAAFELFSRHIDPDATEKLLAKQVEDLAGIADSMESLLSMN